MNGLVRHSAHIYTVAYFGSIILMALLEWAVPRRTPGETLGRRWFGNFGITIIGAVVVRSMFPVAAVGWAVFCSDRGWGLLHLVRWPGWGVFVVTVLIIDLLNYSQHYLLHRVPVLWRLHLTHHTDQEYDFTTGVRFHPLETIYATTFLFVGIAVLGAPALAVFVSQLITAGQNFLEHANIRVPSSVDRVLRLVFVTPDMHCIHHSQDVRESWSNFANTFSWWDRLFGTYVAQPAAGHNGIVFGVAEFTDRKHLTVPWMLAQPFLRGDAPETQTPTSLELSGSTNG